MIREITIALKIIVRDLSLMRNFIFILVFILIECGEVQVIKKDSNLIEVPRMAFKLIVESEVDPCSICARKKMDEAVSMLVRKYEVGKIIKIDKSCGFTRAAECGKNEFVLSCYKQREPYVVPGDGSEKLFPLLVFRFHTPKEHLVGIAESDYTPENYSDTINSMDLNSTSYSDIEIIYFKYGDGPSFNYYKEKNQVVVNCKVILFK